jgi:DnaA family protein
MPQQLTLNNISLRDGFRFESFHVSPENQDMFANLQDALSATEYKQIFLWGIAETGKSHLLQSCCYDASQKGIQVSYLPLTDLHKHGIRILEGVEHSQIIAVDDVDTVLHDKAWETALFNLINESRNRQQTLLLSASENPRHLPCQLPDLASRLIWDVVYKIHPLDDENKRKALQTRAHQRGFLLQDKVIDYIYKRYPRNFETLINILDTLDRESLSRKSIITIPFVKKILGE